VEQFFEGLFGDVLGLYGCQTVSLYGMDLYGCGVYGLSAQEGSSDISVYGCTLRDCSAGPFYFDACEGYIAFYDCDLSGSLGGGSFWNGGGARLSFYDCRFGEAESNVWYFRDDAYTENCQWSEITSYPDYSDWYEDEVPVFSMEGLSPIRFDRLTLEDTSWVGYVMTDAQTGQAQYLPYESDDGSFSVWLHLYVDESAILKYGTETFSFDWYCDSDYSACLESPERSMSLSLYAESGEGEHTVWMMLRTDDSFVWLY